MNSIKNIKKNFFLVLVVFNILTCLGQGSVRLTKMKLFFDRSSANKNLEVWNVSGKEQTYTAFLRKSNMDENGSYTKDTIHTNSLNKHIRFFPRKFTLGPGELQKVRIQVRDWDGLAKNDDYTHLFIKEDLPSKAPSDTNSKKETKTNVKVTVEVGIPLILQKMETEESRFEISESELIDNNKLRLNLNRIGEKSKYCKIKIFHVDSETNERTKVGTLNNVAIFSNQKQRNILINLTKVIDSGRLEIDIMEDSDRKKAKKYLQKILKV